MGSRLLILVNCKSILIRIICFGMLIFLTNCLPIETKNGNKAYEYWSGEEPPKEIEIIEGEYYQSPHFTLEFEFFLKFKPNEEWHLEFLKQNKFEKDTLNGGSLRLTKPPEWFLTDHNFEVYSKNDEYDRSRYFVNRKNGLCYLYVTIGM